MVNFSAAIIASCAKKTISSWYELGVGVVDYILLWDAGRLTVRDDKGMESDRVREALPQTSVRGADSLQNGTTGDICQS